MPPVSNITYELVRRACCELLARGISPTRPAVQDLLILERYIGQKGSNAVVQRYISDFKKEIGENLKRDTLLVEGIPDGFAEIVNSSFSKIVDICRRLALEELKEERASVGIAKAECDRLVEESKDKFVLSEQARIKAETERNSYISLLEEAKLREVTLITVQERLQQNLNDANLNSSSLQNEILRLTEEVSRQKVGKDLLAQEHKVKIEDIDKINQEERGRLLEDIDNLRQKLKKLERSAQDSARKISELDQMNRRLTEEKVSLSSKIEVLVEDKLQKDERLSALSETIGRLTEDKVSVQNDLQASLSTIEALKAELLKAQADKKVKNEMAPKRNQ